MEKVSCALCGIERRRLGAHIKASHGMTVVEYQDRFPEALIDAPGSRTRSPECRAKMASAAKKRWSDPKEREAQSDRLKTSAPWKGKKLSEEHRKAIGDGGRGVSHNLTPKQRQEFAQRGAASLAKIRLQPEYSAKLAAGVHRRIEKGEIVGLMDPAAQRKSYESRVRNGTLVPPNSGRGICGWREGLNHYTRSTLEANFAKVLLAAGILYEYEGRLFRLPSGRHYLPDFYLHQPLSIDSEKGFVVSAGWVELKGWRHKDGALPKGVAEKIAEFEGHLGTVVQIVVGTDPLWKMLRRQWQPRIPLWETLRRNLRTHPDLFGR